jgi:hypothetical protein
MNRENRKTLEDFPKFHVSRVTRGETDPQGFTAFELDGEFDRGVGGVGEVTWFWLLIGERLAVCAQWKSLNEDGRSATLVTHEKELPDIFGKTLYYLSPFWQAFNIWMVLDEKWGWKHVRFQAIDAVAEAYQADVVSIVDGREVKTWTKLQRAHNRGHTKRYAPAAEQTSMTRAEKHVVPGGWDHEHCELCRGHIDDGDFGYRDPDDRWMCKNCYNRYVKRRDLSFVHES